MPRVCMYLTPIYVHTRRIIVTDFKYDCSRCESVQREPAIIIRLTAFRHLHLAHAYSVIVREVARVCNTKRWHWVADG